MFRSLYFCSPESACGFGFGEAGAGEPPDGFAGAAGGLTGGAAGVGDGFCACDVPEPAPANLAPR